ncbi:MAG TPA: AI-2E family transporter, partial [Candidatus Polarisedimenticolia bacterium]|nr:AI-2E family transporter [Candidatus Polarisedimenticolia bacterium]
MSSSNQPKSDITHIVLSVLFIGILIVASVWIFLPFLMTLMWAALIVVATWPLLLKLDAKLGGKRGLAVTVMTLAALLLLLIPLTVAIVMIVSHAEDIPERIKGVDVSAYATPPKWIAGVPVVGEKIAEKWTAFFGLSEEARREALAPYAKSALQWFLGKVGGVGVILAQSLLTLILAAILYANGDVARTGILMFARRLA